MSGIDVNINENDRLKELKRLKTSYVMYEKAKQDAVNKRNTLTDKHGNKLYNSESLQETINLMNNMQQDIIDQYMMYGGEKEELLTETIEGYTTYADDIKNEIENTTNNNVSESVTEYLNKLEELKPTEPTKKQISNSFSEFDTSKIKEQFDVIPLPSKGECYANKLSKMPVGYLTAYDENIIVSPNLYRDGTFLDYLLKAKILNPAVNPDELLPGDRDAIILWLRATGYGNEFPVTAVDEETGKEFSSVVDLSKIEYKPFNLKGDENGFFDFTLPVTKDEIKFKFLTYRDVQRLNEMEQREDMSLKRQELKSISDKITKFKNDDLSKTYNKQFTKRIDETIKTLDEWYDMIEDDDNVKISHTLTNRLIMSIKSINGITDERFIKEYVVKMNIRDSAALRNYIATNEPGLDYNVEIERPKSLGGGSMTTFLTLDQFIFLNIA